MSFFDRPDSPPPREPSPEPIQTPLPSPHLSARDRRRQQRASSPLVPPGLAPPRTLVQSRSFDHLSRDSVVHTLKRRTRSNLEPQSPPTVAAPSPYLSPRGGHQHRRTTSVSVPHSPPTTPARSRGSSPIPPVPPLPDSARSSPLFKANIRAPVTPIYLPELHELSPASNSLAPTPTAPEKKSVKRLPSLFSLSSAAGSVKTESTSTSPSSLGTEKDPKAKNGVAMTCLKFFTMNRHSSSKNLRSSATQ